MILKVNNLSKKFNQGSNVIEVFKNINLSVEKGDTVAVIGPSGSGKTTFLSLVAGLDHPTAGEIVIDGQNLALLSESQLTQFRAQRIGIIFQQFNLFSHLTALENIALPLELKNDPAALEKAQKAISSVGLDHRKNHFPSQMSGGEQQRVAIARAFIVEPALLLADEPSGNLDSKTGDQVMQLLFDLVEKNKMTLLLITHNETLAEKCNHRFFIDKNRLTDAKHPLDIRA